MCSFLLCAFFAFTLAAQAIAIDSDCLITIDEYSAAIQAEGAKYGVECVVVDYDPSIQITQEMLDSALENLRNCITGFSVTVVDAESIPEIDSNSITPFSMPIRDIFKGPEGFRIECPYGYAFVRGVVDATVNAQNGDVMEVHDVDVEQYGGYTNFHSWTVDDISYTENRPRSGFVEITFSGMARFSYADPITGVETGVSFDVIDEEVHVECW